MDMSKLFEIDCLLNNIHKFRFLLTQVSVRKPSRLMLFRGERNAVYHEIYTEHTSKISEQNAEF